MSEAPDDLGWWPARVAAHYGLPADRDATGQCVGVIAAGGGFDPADLEAAAAAGGGSAPRVLVRRGVNSPGQDPRADEELALDLQVLAAAAPGAVLAVYFAAQAIADIGPAIAAAVADAVARPRVLVVCWGSSEDTWPDAAIAATEAALAQAARQDISVVVASGDFLASAGFAGQAHVFYPAASPQVLACGGTDLVFDAAGQLTGEQVWNEPMQRRGTGGGISGKFPPPDYQRGLALPASAVAGAGPGRGVPDVAALAGPSPGWRIRVGGQDRVSGGTSAAAPLWAAILALANARRARPIGAPHRLLYARPDLLRGIVQGDNRVLEVGYDANAGWNACTGLGVPIGAALLAALIAAD
ncbi:S53 family peptidase [Phenylobacterium sp.]|uniref:S53 family peptidase n=1 Tax=Phenylobacterium sp. TaxID=1871053 RepID=UPI0025D9EB3F|nr:S53 family peptidase [Phenylobacterium sp.]